MRYNDAMALYITEVIYGCFKKSYTELTVIKSGRARSPPAKDDIIHLKDKRYPVLQRDFFSSNHIKIYVKEI